MSKTAKDFLDLEPMKYWAVPKGNDYDKQILRNPEKFPQYTFTPKMDGEWNKLIWDGEVCWMLSRTRNVEGEFTNRAAKVPHILDEICQYLPAETVLLGELAFGDVSRTSKDVGSIMRSLTPRAIKLQEHETNKLIFYVFDCLMWAGEDLSTQTYAERFINNAALKQFFSLELSYSDLLSPQPITVLPDFLKEYFAHGGEGVVLMDSNAPYAFGKRPVRSSVKIKKQLADFEALVLDTLEPNMAYEGKEIDNWQYWEGDIAVTKPYFNGWKNGLECEYEGRLFSVTSGLTDADREWLATSEARAAIDAGKLYAVCSAMELTQDSVRHPYLVRIRDDM